MSLYQDIRGALQNRLLTVSGLPSSVAYEGVPFKPVQGTPFVEPVFQPINGRPATCGPDHFVLHEGLFNVAVVYPAGQGTGAAEAMADLIKEAFRAGTVLTLNANQIRTHWAERKAVLHDAGWVRVPVSISWYLYSTSY